MKSKRKAFRMVGLVVGISIIAGIFTGCGCEHKYSSEITKEATCAEEGVLTYTCDLCGQSYTKSLPKSEYHTYISKVTKEATCAEEGVLTYTCDLCGESYTKSLPKSEYHTYISKITKEATVKETGIITYTCSVCGDSYTEIIDKEKGSWDIGYYVDEFGDKTNYSYAIGIFTGTFSNSATTNSKLTVYVYLDTNYLSSTAIRLFEYGSSKATFLSSETITLKTKDSFGKIKSYNLVYSDGDLYSYDKSLRDAILGNKELSIVITSSSKYQTIADTYIFKIDNLGLAEILQ